MNSVYPSSLESIIEFFKKFPGIGEKSAERMALSILNIPLDEIQIASNALVKARETLHPCDVCGNLTDSLKCNICEDEARNKNLICVVEDYKSIYAFEKAGNFKGVYHVLNGLISPIDDIGVDDINLSSLIRRIKELENPELILALKGTIEGETTTLYIKKIFENKNVKISRLSYGLTSGAEIDYLDMSTIEKALKDRKIISE